MLRDLSKIQIAELLSQKVHQKMVNHKEAKDRWRRLSIAPIAVKTTQEEAQPA